MKTRVSGVPYEVDIPEGYEQFKATDYASYDEMIATLEQENRQMRARMDRLEDELRTANELLTKAHIDLLNERRRARYYEEND